MSILGDAYDTAIKGFEGWAPKASWDYAQYTNGWGTKARYPGEAIDKDEAQRRYDDEIAKAHASVRSFAPNLDPGTTAALTDLTFNAGPKWQSAGLGEAIRQGDLDKARQLYAQYNKAGGQTLPGLVNRRAVGAQWIGGGQVPTASDGQNAMAQAYPWNMLQWPGMGTSDPTVGDLNTGMASGPQVAPRPDLPSMFASIPPQSAPQAGPPLPPPRGPQGAPPDASQPSRSSLLASIIGMGTANAQQPAQSQSDDQPSWLQKLSMNPLVMGGIMTALDAAKGGSGVEGFKSGAGSAAGIQEAWMKDYALRQQIQKENAIKSLLASGQGMDGVPAPLLAIAKATGDVSPVVQHLTKSGTDDIKEYEYAVRGGFNGTFQQWMEKKKNMNGEYAKQLVYGTNAAGDIVPMQAGSKGDLTASKLPEGVKLQRDPIKMDAGTHYVLMDPTTRQPIGIVPKNVAEVERQKGVGDAQGKAQADLPKMESIAKSLTDKIDAVEKDPYLPNMVGTVAGRTPNITEKARTLQSKIDQLKGYAFLQAFESLKGAGAITEVEGAKATQAMTRLHEMIQSGQDYREALRDFKNEVNRILELKRTQARGVQGGGSVAAPVIQPPPMPSGGQVSPVPGSGWSIQRVD